MTAKNPQKMMLWISAHVSYLRLGRFGDITSAISRFGNMNAS